MNARGVRSKGGSGLMVAALTAWGLVAARSFTPRLAGAAEGSAHAHAAAQGSEGDTFQGLMDDAIARMHAGMAVTPSGDPDVDFARMMIPHHQGAVDMALVELRFGHDERLRRLAQGIIVEQRQEIEVMRAALRDAEVGRPRAPSGSK